jgi:NAD(P)-dependent dehydrogenase (short-subunit alcohol dehydrogenase family)
MTISPRHQRQQWHRPCHCNPLPGRVTPLRTVRSVDKAAKLQAMAADAGAEVNLVELDVADDESVRVGFARIFEATDGVVDVLVNNAGIGGNAVAEECATSTYLDVMNVNLCGAVRCLHQVLPGMRARHSGAIVNITSIAGRVAALAQSPYVTSKWAFEGLSEGLARAGSIRHPYIVEPGVTKCDRRTSKRPRDGA